MTELLGEGNENGISLLSRTESSSRHERQCCHLCLALRWAEAFLLCFRVNSLLRSLPVLGFTGLNISWTFLYKAKRVSVELWKWAVLSQWWEEAEGKTDEKNNENVQIVHPWNELDDFKVLSNPGLSMTCPAMDSAPEVVNLKIFHGFVSGVSLLPWQWMMPKKGFDQF